MAECTIYDKLRYISETKDLIKMAIESQDVEVLESDTFRKYAEYITEIRKVSSVNGMQGDVVITLEDLGGITIDALNGYATEQWVEDKGYITGFTIPEEYVTEDDLTNYYTKEEVDEAIDNVDVTEQLQNYYTKEESDGKFLTEHQSLEDYYTKEEIEGKKYLTEVPSEYITEEELADTLDIITEMGEDIASLEENKQDKLTQGTGIKIENNVISLDYSYDLFEVVTELPTENINENKIYLVQDTDGGEENAFVEYIYVNGKFEEVGKFKTTVDLTGYATEQWVSEQGFLTEVPEEYVTDTDLDEALDGYATEQWVEDKKYLTEHQSLENYYTKEEIEGKKYLQAIPDTYVTEDELSTQLSDKVTQTALNEAINEVGDVIEALEGDIAKKQDILVSGTNIKTINGNSLLGEGDITIEGGSGGINESELHHILHTYKYPYINEVEVDPSLNNVKFLSIEYINENGQYKTTNETVKFKTINDNSLLGEGDINIEGITKKDLFNNEIAGVAYPYINFVNASDNKIYLGALWEDENNATGSKLPYSLNFKTINGNSVLGEGDITIEGGSIDLDLFEVVSELPTENIDENKIYLIKDPTASNKVISVEGMTPSTDYNWDDKDTYIQDGEATIDGTTINNDKRTRVTIKGFEGDFYIMLGLSLAPMDIIAEQLYIQLQHLNEDTSSGKPDTWNYREGGQVGEGQSWTTIGLGTLDPTQEYFVDIWTNGGQASVGGVDFYLPSYIAVPQSEVSDSQFIEYIYNNGEWEMLGKSIKMVDPKAYRSIGVDSNGSDGKSYAIFSKADGSGDVLEVAKINGKTMIGWEAQELSLAETKEVTQEEYDSLTPENGVIYIITDAEEMGIPTKVSQLENDSKFIAEGNLKTINGNSLIGEGDITIEGGGGDMTNYYTKEEIDALIGGVETKITEINGMI